MSNELDSFIRTSLERGIARADIHGALVRAGWQENEIQHALNAFADVVFPVPVPKKKLYLAAKEAFLYLVSFITLYIAAFGFGTLVFSFIETWIPDPLQYGGSGVPRYAVASLLVAFPIFFFVTRLVRQAQVKDPEKKDSRVRKWLTYLTLVLAAGILMGDLIAVLASLLGGELTLRFLLKALTVFAITGAIFGFYLTDLQKEEKEP